MEFFCLNEGRHFRNGSNKLGSRFFSRSAEDARWNVRIASGQRNFTPTSRRMGETMAPSPVIPGLRVLFWFQYRHEGFGTVRSPPSTSPVIHLGFSRLASQDLHSTPQLRLVSLPRIYVISELPTVRDEPFHKHESFVTQVE